MILSACGYKTSAEIHAQLGEYLVQQKKLKLDWTALVQVLTQLKKLELAQDPTNEGDEYIDAFVALGGEPDKSGFVQKDMLIEIIKIEFELTIDMVVRLLHICRNTCARSAANLTASTTTSSACCSTRAPAATPPESAATSRTRARPSCASVTSKKTWTSWSSEPLVQQTNLRKMKHI